MTTVQVEVPTTMSLPSGVLSVNAFAAVLQRLDVGCGDRVVIYMPNMAEAVFAMLACARVGAIHSVVFGGFASASLATRIDDAQPKLILAASCGLEPNRIVPYKPLLDRAIELAAHKPASCLVLQRPMCEASMIAARIARHPEAARVQSAFDAAA